MAELVDASDLSSGAVRRLGSSPSSSTTWINGVMVAQRLVHPQDMFESWNPTKVLPYSVTVSTNVFGAFSLCSNQGRATNRPISSIGRATHL